MNRRNKTSWLQKLLGKKPLARNVKRQRRKRRFRVAKYLGVSAALLLALWAGVRWGLPQLPFFDVKKIVVLGEPKTMEPQQIKQQLKAQVPAGANLFALDLIDLQRHIASHDYFSAVQVRRRLPHTLEVVVSEYQPAFVLYTSRLYYVDALGKVFRDITQTKESRDYPIVTGFSEEDLLTQPTLTQKRLRQAARLRDLYEKTAFAATFGLSEIHFQKNLGYTLYPEQKKYSIKFGSEDFTAKTKKLNQVLSRLEEAKLKFSSIDLSYPGKVLMTL